MALLLSDVRTSFERLKRDISDVSNATFIEWCDWINKSFYNEASVLDPERFVSTQSYTVVTTPQTSNLPASYKNASAYGLGVYLVDSSGADVDQMLPITGSGSRETGYYITSSSIVFTGNENQTYKLRYLPEQTKLTALTDYFTIDALVNGKVTIEPRHLEFLVKALDVLYNQWDEMPGSESLADFRYARALDAALEDYRKLPTVYSTSDFSLNY